MEDKKVVPVPEVHGWKHNEIQKYQFTKAKGLRFKMNGTQKQLKKTAIRKKRVMIRAKFAGSSKSFIGKHFNDLSL